MSSTVLNFTLKWFINSLQKIGHCIYVLFNEQTKLFLSFESAENVPNICIPIPENGGLIKFSIGTLSAREILVKKIEIEFPAELQLTDPDGGTFFEPNSNNRDDSLPFRLTWEGKHTIGPKRLVAFAVKARFVDNILKRNIRITVYAQKQTVSYTGFERLGPIQVHSEMKSVISTASHIRGLGIPPLYGCALIQPNLINSGITLEGQAPVVGPVVVHQQFMDGTVSSHQVLIKRKKDGG